MTAFTSIATATASHFNHKVTLFTPSDPPHSGDLKNVSFREVQTAGGGDTRSNPYTWTPQITKPKKKMQPPYISWTQTYETCTSIAIIPTSSHVTHKLKISLLQLLLLLPILTAPCTQTLTPTNHTQNKWLNLHNYHKNLHQHEHAWLLLQLPHKLLTQLSHHSLPILHIEKSMWSVGHIQ